MIVERQINLKHEEKNVERFQQVLGESYGTDTFYSLCKLTHFCFYHVATVFKNELDLKTLFSTNIKTTSRCSQAYQYSIGQCWKHTNPTKTSNRSWTNWQAYTLKSLKVSDCCHNNKKSSLENIFNTRLNFLTHISLSFHNSSRLAS